MSDVISDTDELEPKPLTVTSAANVVILVEPRGSLMIPRGVIVDGHEVPCVTAAQLPLEPLAPLAMSFTIHARRIVTMTREAYERAKAAGAER